MTLKDMLAREAIRATMARYAIAADAADYELLAQCFTVDGVLCVVGGLVLMGRDAIVDALSSRANARGHGAQIGIFQRHVLGTCHITFQGNAAQAVTYYHVVTEIGPDHAGRYVDHFIVSEEEWLIVRRDASVDWFDPKSRFAAALRR
ncbi:MAG: DUF4440 domain-containing protein [Rhodospirillaceae bacterium]|nr:MAG: DUF4440 domain-containing protein [Rhodospirillaceae bacterium]